MAVVKVLEVIAQSESSWEDAAQVAVSEVARTVRNIQSIWVSDFQATVEADRITRYRVTAKVSFIVDDYLRDERGDVGTPTGGEGTPGGMQEESGGGQR
ncbi:MAG TPA: dodecin family protein [bacterium]|nr:dodecin family protein [bacterium]